MSVIHREIHVVDRWMHQTPVLCAWLCFSTRVELDDDLRDWFHRTWPGERLKEQWMLGLIDRTLLA